MSTRFHLAIPVDDLAAARGFYGGVLGCTEGRAADSWADYDLAGHQLTLHCVGRTPEPVFNDVDGDRVPLPHFGLVLDIDAWEVMATKLRAAGTKFVIEPHVRFAGQPGEQATMFLHDPAGNALEFKAFRDIGRLFAR